MKIIDADVTDIIDRIITAIRKAGIPCNLRSDEIVIDGEIHRFSTNGRPSDKAGWYVFFSHNNFVAGSFGDWRSGIKETFYSREIESLSPKDRSIIRQKQEEITRKIQCKKEEAKRKAVELLKKAKPPDAKHPYLVKKGIKPIGEIKQLGNALIIPIRDINKNLLGLQYIYEDGDKKFLSGSSIKGNFFQIGSGFPIYICEGYATGASIYQAIDGEGTVVIAFNAGNLKRVTEVLRKEYPEAEIIICADNDQWTKGNPGKIKGEEAAKAVCAKIALPKFKDTFTKPTDFNDLHVLEGLEEVRKQIDKAEYPHYIQKEREEVFKRLALLSPSEYDFIRKIASKALGLKLSTLDKEVKARNREAEKDNGKEDFIEQLKPANEEVNGQELLDEIYTIIRKHVVLNEKQAIAVSLWTVLTYCYDCFFILPILGISSPQKRCGKTTLLRVLRGLVKAEILASNITPSALFRVIEKYKPTLLIDEADTFLKDNQELTGILNSGHTKDTAFTVRSEKMNDDFEPKKFSTWCPKAIALIGNLPDTLADRAIDIRLERKLTTEKTERLELDFKDWMKPIRQKILRWTLDNEEMFKKVRKEINVNNDRAKDNWLPLLAIAEVAGEEWFKKAQNAMLYIESIEEETSLAQELLKDIKFIFEEKGKIEKIASAKLVDELVKLEDRPWGEWKRGKPMTPNSLARLLKPFGIHPKTIRDGFRTYKGYEVKAFEEVFKRYIPSNTPIQTVTTEHYNNINKLSKNQTVTEKECVTDKKIDNPLKSLSCYGVTDETAGNKVKAIFLDDNVEIKIKGEKGDRY
ncbi:DUF3631 domain-containing protein [Desulfothermus sp.]